MYIISYIQSIAHKKNQYFQGERAQISVSLPAPDTQKRHSIQSGVFCARYLGSAMSVDRYGHVCGMRLRRSATHAQPQMLQFDNNGANASAEDQGYKVSWRDEY